MESDESAIAEWRCLREHETRPVTMLDLYDLVARRRGVAPHELPLNEREALARAVMPDLWPGWSTTEGSERPGDRVTVVEYDPAWPHRYAQWHRAITAALGDTAIRVEHVGSTSVPGLAAKPIIDVQVSVADLADEQRYMPALESLGLQLRSRDELHRYFRPFPGRPRDVHVHVCEAGSTWEEQHLRFRDHLRTDPEARAAYARVKREAAARWADDRFAYTDAKTAIILELLGGTCERGSD